MRELLPLYLAAALGNHLLLLALLPTPAPAGATPAANSAWPMAGAVLALIPAIALPSRLGVPVANFLCLTALAAIALSVARADARVVAPAPAWRRHLHGIAAIAGGNCGALAYALLSGAELRPVYPTCLAASLLFALLFAALPSFDARLALGGLPAPRRDGPLSLLAVALLGLALAGLGPVLPW